MICPAFQSAFIYNDNEREKLFAYFGEDSLPLLHGQTNKSKFGIIEDMTRRKRKDNFRTVKMERIYPEKELEDDSLLLALNSPLEGEGGNIDSLINAPQEKVYHYNVEQANYNRLFGKYIYKPPPPEADDVEESDESVDQGVDASEEVPVEMSRKEKRKARKEAKAKEREEAKLEEGSSNISIE